MSIKQELRAYYAKQGLTGKHLRKALQWDMKAVTAKSKGHWRKPTSLMDLHWASMPASAGRELYWAHRYMQTGK